MDIEEIQHRLRETVAVQVYALSPKDEEGKFLNGATRMAEIRRNPYEDNIAQQSAGLFLVLEEGLSVNGEKPSPHTITLFMHRFEDHSNNRGDFDLYPFAQGLREHIRQTMPEDRAKALIEQINTLIMPHAPGTSFTDRFPGHAERNIDSGAEIK